MMPSLYRRFRTALPLIVGVLLAVAGAYMIAYATRWGPWAESDSVEYVEVARNLVAGKGLVLVRASGSVVPLYLRPPLYPIALSGFLGLGLGAIEAGRWFAISLFFCLVLIPSGICHLVQDRYVLPLSIAAYILTVPSLVVASSGLMSDSLFLLLSMLAIGLSVASLRYNRRALMPIAVVFAGLAWLTRFAGVACLIVVALVPFFENETRSKGRIGRSLAVALMGALPLAIWTLSIRALGYSPGVYALPAGHLWDLLQPVRGAFVDMLWEWLPLRLFMPLGHYLARAAVLLLLCPILAWAVVRLLLRVKRHKGNFDSQILTSIAGILFLLFAAAHAVVVAISYLVVVLPKPALDQRVLMPSEIAFSIGLVFVLYNSVTRPRVPGLRLVLPLAFILPAVWTGWPSTLRYVGQLHAEGQGYTSRAWQESPIVDAVRTLPPSLTIVSNDPDAVMFFAQRPAFQIPELAGARPAPSWVRFGDKPQSNPETLFASGRAALVLFSQGRYQFRQLYGEKAPERLGLLLKGLKVFYEASDGGIYLLPNP